MIQITLRTIFATLLIANVALAQGGLDPNGQCVGDGNGDAEVSIDELVTAVNNALGGCADREIQINFAAAIGDQDFACGQTYENQGASGSPLRVTDFRFYVSNVRLLKSNGDEVPLDLEQDDLWQRDDLALLDFEDGTSGCSAGNEGTNSMVRGTAPAGVYTGIRFELGVPFDMNHGNAELETPPLNVTSMFWNWNGGYKFIRVDAFAGPIDAAVNYNLHLGSTGCEGGTPVTPPGQPCANPNRPEITLHGFDPATNIIVADLAPLLADADLESNQMETAPGCQSQPFDMDCDTVFPKLGLPFGETPAGAQQLFRVE